MYNALNMEYYGKIGVGTPFTQFLRVAFDTGSSAIWIVDASCNVSECLQKNRFNSSLSSTFREMDEPWKMIYSDRSYATGTLGNDCIGVNISYKSFSYSYTVYSLYHPKTRWKNPRKSCRILSPRSCEIVIQITKYWLINYISWR